MDLSTEIKALIALRQEGAYWDFKREWYGDRHKGDLLKDIICMANNLVNRDAYIIIGVDEEQDYAIRDVRNDPNRRNTQMMVTFLRDKKFAGDFRPIVLVDGVELEDGMVDVIIVRNSANTPFYLKDKFEMVRPNHIYTRVQDSNTSSDASADIQHVEYLWKKRFGLILSPLERMKIYLQHPEDWIKNLPQEGSVIKYYRYAPEYTIERTWFPDDGRDGYEYYNFVQTDSRPRWGDIRLYYHRTLLGEFGCAILDGGRYITVCPNKDVFPIQEAYTGCVTYSYLVKDTLRYYLHEFLYEKNNDNVCCAHNKHMDCILLFESEHEREEFIIYAMARWSVKEKYGQEIWLPYFPESTEWNMEYFENEYINSQILQRMLSEFRGEE